MNIKKFFLIQLHLMSNILLVVAMIGAAKSKFEHMNWNVDGDIHNIGVAKAFKKNVAIGEDAVSSPAYVNLSAINGFDAKYFDIPFNKMKRLSDHEVHPRRHQRNRVVHPIKKSLETNSNEFRFLSSNYHSPLSNSTDFPSENDIKLHAQPLLSMKKGRQSSSQNGLNKNDKQANDESQPTPNMYPLKSTDYGMRRIDRKRRANRMMNFRMEEKKILDQILGKGVYDPRIRPAGIYNNTDGKSSTIVNVNIYLRSINDIDDYKMEFSVQITFREQWNDERLKFNDYNGRFNYLTLTDPKKVWMPDTFFRNEKVGHFHAILVNNAYVRVFPGGDVLYSIRISLTLACPMNLKLYPMDRQTCSLRIASYGYTTDDITYRWKNTDPVQIAKGLNLPRFSVEKYASRYCNVKTNTGEYSCLSVDLVFKRQFSYYLITIYVPGCMLVVVSWVSFWLDPHAVPARVALGVTTLLTMSTQTASINNSLPPVAYTKAIDVWQGVCVTFVFSALLEYALVNYALRGDRSYMLRRAMARRRRRAGGYSGDDDDYDGGGDDMDYGMDFDDDEEDYDDDGLFSTQETKDTTNSSDLFQSHSSTNDVSYNAGGQVSKNVIFSQDESKSRSNLRRRSGALSFLPPFGSFKRKSKWRKNKPEIRNNILMNPPSTNEGSIKINSNNPGLLIPSKGNHTLAYAEKPMANTGSTTHNDYNEEGGMHVINGGFLSDNGAHLDTTKLSNNQSNISVDPVLFPSVHSIKLTTEMTHSKYGKQSVPMEKAKRIDVTARILFPLIFATFNLAYWLNYLLQAQSEFQALLLRNETHSKKP